MTTNGVHPVAPPEEEFLADVINVPVASLFVDHRYQRGIKKSSVKNLVDNWSWKRYIPIIVVARGDRFAVVDGQQRTAAALELGIEWLPAILIVGKSLEDEAERFVGANTGVAVGAGDRFRAEFLRKEARYLDIASEVKLSGFHLACLAEGGQGAITNPYTIEAVHAIEGIYNQGMLVAVLTTVAQAFGGNPDRDMVTGNMLQGVHLALKHLGRFGVTQEEFVDSLRGLSVREVMDMGHDRYKSMVTSRSIPGGIAAVLVERYNYRKPVQKTVPPYDRSGARATRSYYGAQTQMAQPGYQPFGGADTEAKRRAWLASEAGQASLREQAEKRRGSKGKFVRRAS